MFYNEAAELLIGRPFAELGEIPSLEFGETLQLADADGTPLRRRDSPAGVAFFERRPSHQVVFITTYDGARRTVEATAYPLFGAAQRHARRAHRLLGAGRERKRSADAGASVGMPRVAGGAGARHRAVRRQHVLRRSAPRQRAHARARRRYRHAPARRRDRSRSCRRAAHPLDAPSHGPSPGAGLLSSAVPIRGRRARVGTGVARAEPRRPHRALPVTAAVPGALGRHPGPGHVPRRAGAKR